MFHQIIQRQKNNWLASKDCAIKEVVEYIKQKGELRTPQIEAIETYLFLKIKGQNKPLWQLFTEGFFIENVDIDKLHINQETRDFLSQGV